MTQKCTWNQTSCFCHLCQQHVLNSEYSNGNTFFTNGMSIDVCMNRDMKIYEKFIISCKENYTARLISSNDKIKCPSMYRVSTYLRVLEQTALVPSAECCFGHNRRRTNFCIVLCWMDKLSEELPCKSIQISTEIRKEANNFW